MRIRKILIEIESEQGNELKTYCIEDDFESTQVEEEQEIINQEDEFSLIGKFSLCGDYLVESDKLT